MSQDKLCSLAMLSLERLLVSKPDFKDWINDFATRTVKQEWLDSIIVQSC